MWARGLRRRGLAESGPPAPGPLRGVPGPSVFFTVPPPADRRLRRLVPAQATLPCADTAPGAQIPPQRLRTPALGNSTRRGGPNTYLLLGVSGGSQPPRRVFASLKSLFCNVGAQRLLPLAHARLLNRKFFIGNFLFPTLPLSPSRLLLPGTVWWKTWPQTPAFIFFPTCQRRSLPEATSPYCSYW